MPSRRSFIASLTWAGVLAGSSSVPSQGLAAMRRGVDNAARIKSLQLRDDAIVRYPTINGDNWHMTWGADGRQYCGLCDGYFNRYDSPRFYNSRLISIEGGPQTATFDDVPGYPELAEISARFTPKPRYYGFGVVSSERRIYQFLSTWSRATKIEDGFRYVGVKLIYSPDGGRTWRNQDGSSPVTWEDWDARSRDRTMLFLEEPQDAFSVISVLQMGKDYADNRDGYIYLYAPNGNSEGTMNQLVMLRVPKQQMLNRKAYEYFAGFKSQGQARWSSRIEDRAVVHTFPKGWVNTAVHPWAWVPSVTYNAGLGLYMMANWATGPGSAPTMEWFQKPSYLGFWVSATPWGPWQQVYETTAWTPGNDSLARCYSPVIAPRWIAEDGKSFWLVWTDYQEIIKEGEYRDISNRATFTNLDPAMQAHAYSRLHRLARPYYCINAQRVDLNLS